jgi:Transposase
MPHLRRHDLEEDRVGRRQGPLAGDGPRPLHLRILTLSYRDCCNRRAAGRSLTTPQSGPVLMLWTAPPPARKCHGCGAVKAPHDSEPHMQAVTTIGLDIAKSVFQIHGVDAAGNVIVRRQLKRRYALPFFQRLPPCLIGIEACASSHHWSRELKALGHTVRLIPAAYVKPYVKRQKNDAADAEAICEAVTRANMRFVATKTLEQQSCLMLHRTRHLFMAVATSLSVDSVLVDRSRDPRAQCRHRRRNQCGLRNVRFKARRSARCRRRVLQQPAHATGPSGNALRHSCGLFAARVYLRRRAHELWAKSRRRVPAGRRIRRPHPQGRKTCGPAGGAVEQVRAGHK